MKLITIGVYGFTADNWFAALAMAGVDTFVDVRQRRGVRGSQYAFVNSKRLQARLSELGIRYLHRKDLAPTKAIREAQSQADRAQKVAKRQRTELGTTFVRAYTDDILASFDPQTLIAELPEDSRVVALFCVEREPAACHRSLLADFLHTKEGWPVAHLMPPIETERPEEE